MTYLIPIKTALLLFPLIAFLFTIPFILMQYHKYGAIHFFRALIIYTFILYLLTVYFLVIMPLPTFEEALKNTGPYFNFQLFSFVGDFFRETSLVWSDASTYIKALTEPCFYVVIFNIFMLVPFGMYLRYYFKCSLCKTIFYSFLLSLFFEVTQATGLYFIYPNPYRLFDVDDLFLNTLGGMLGYFIMGIFLKLLPSREMIDEEALEKGKEVSGLRRITVFMLDLSLYFVFSLIGTIFVRHFFVYNFGVYFIIWPILFRQQTMGMKFLNVRMVYKKWSELNIILRSLFLGFFYFILPIWIMIGIGAGISVLHIQVLAPYCYLGGLILILMVYLINVIMILINKKIYYDKLFGFSFVSTILENDLSIRSS